MKILLRHNLESGPRAGSGPSGKADHGPLEKADATPKIYCMS